MQISWLTSGKSSPLCITSLTFNSNLRPKAPPGWDIAKSSRVKPLACSSAMAMASPITKVAVVLDVGASPSGQASSGTSIHKCTLDNRAIFDSGLPVTAITGTPIRWMTGIKVRISLDSPEFEIAKITSLSANTPRSPWLASPGCTKNAGVPVLARVAEILLPIWPDLPIPMTITLPVQLRINSQASANSAESTY